MGVQSITTLPALAVTVGSAQLRGEIVLGPSWPDANGYIYNEGEHEEMWVEGATQEFPTLSKEADHLKVFCPSHGWGAWVTDERVNVSRFSTLKVTWSYTNPGFSVGVTVLRLSTTKTGGSIAEVNKSWSSAGTVTSSLDISSLTGEFYVQFIVYGAMMSISGSLYKLWLE